MEAQAASQLTGIILKPENLIVVVGIFVLMRVLYQVWPELWEKPIFVRLLPIYPLILAQVSMWIPGLAQSALPIGDRIFLALFLGFAAGHGFKLIKQTGLGQDSRIKPRDLIQ